MIAAVSVSIADPGPGGFVLGGLLIVGGWAALRWLRRSARRARAAVGIDTRPDATAVLPRMREVRRG